MSEKAYSLGRLVEANIFVSDILLIKDRQARLLLLRIRSSGSLNDDWVDPELKYGVPNVRPKEQWLEMTGAFDLVNPRTIPEPASRNTHSS